MSNLLPLPISIDTGWERGYLTSSGGITVGTTADMTSPYIPIFPSISITVSISYDLPTANSGWIAVGFYNSSNSFISSSRVTSSSGPTAIPSDIITIPPSNTAYARVSASNIENNSSAIMSLVQDTHWTMGDDGYPTNNSIEPTKYAMTQPYPLGLWRITKGYNDGLPFHELLPDIPYVTPIPSISQGETTEITDTSSIEYKRYSTTGYTNPDLIRFRDKEFAENVSQKVFIRGVNSYRYTEVDDYEDGSTTSEIP